MVCLSLSLSPSVPSPVLADNASRSSQLRLASSYCLPVSRLPLPSPLSLSLSRIFFLRSVAVAPSASCPDWATLGREAPARVPVILPLFAFCARWWFNPLLTLHFCARRRNRAEHFKKTTTLFILFFIFFYGGGDWHPLR